MQTILVVDDEPSVRFLVRTILEDAGYTVIEAANGATALERANLSRPDVVVTDLMMPVMGGENLIEQLRADRTTAEIPILLLSSTGSLATSADIVLGKPFKPEVLVEAVGLLGAKKA